MDATVFFQIVGAGDFGIVVFQDHQSHFRRDPADALAVAGLGAMMQAIWVP